MFQEKCKPVKEEDANILPIEEYALSKFHAEKYLKEFCFNGAVILRLPGLFGKPRQEDLL